MRIRSGGIPPHRGKHSTHVHSHPPLIPAESSCSWGSAGWRTRSPHTAGWETTARCCPRTTGCTPASWCTFKSRQTERISNILTHITFKTLHEQVRNAWWQGRRVGSGLLTANTLAGKRWSQIALWDSFCHTCKSKWVSMLVMFVETFVHTQWLTFPPGHTSHSTDPSWRRRTGSLSSGGRPGREPWWSAHTRQAFIVKGVQELQSKRWNSGKQKSWRIWKSFY